MSARDTQETREYREALAARQEAFERFAESFAADVAELRAEAEARAREIVAAAELDDVTGAFDAYNERFAAEVADRRGSADLAAGVDAFTADVADRREAVAEYRRSFATDATGRLETAAFREAVGAYRDEALADRPDPQRLAAAIDDFAASFAADVGRLRAGGDDRRRELRAYAEGFAAETGTDRAVVPSDSDANDTTDADGTSVDATESDEAATTGDAPAESDRADESTEPAQTATDERTTDERDTDESAADSGERDTDESPAETDEPAATVADAGAAADDAEDLTAELSEIPYGTLKRAANALEYDGDLNTATKGDLIAFFEDRGREQLREVLED